MNGLCRSSLALLGLSHHRVGARITKAAVPAVSAGIGRIEALLGVALYGF